MTPLMLLSFLGCAPQDADVTARWWVWLAANSSAVVGEDNLTDLDAKATIIECSGRGWNAETSRWDEGYIGPREGDDLSDPRFIGGVCAPDPDDPAEDAAYCADFAQEMREECSGTENYTGVTVDETFLGTDGFYGLTGVVDPWRTEAMLNGEGHLQVTVHHYLEKGQDFRFLFSIDPDFEPTRCISTDSGAEIQKVDGESWVDKWSEDEDGYRIFYLNAGTGHPQSSDAGETDLFYLTTDWLTGFSLSRFASEQFNSVPNSFVAAIPDNRRQSCQDNMDNIPPLCDAGADVLVALGDSVTLTGANSEDLDGDDISYIWIPDGDVSDDISEGVTYDFTPEEPGTYIFTLNASDGVAECEDEIRVVVPDANSIPACDIVPDLIGDIDTTIDLDGEASDIDGDALAYTWTVEGEPEVADGEDPAVITFGDDTATSTSFQADLPGVYELQFTACEGGDCDASGVNVCSRIVTVTLEDPSAPADNLPPLCDVNVDLAVAMGAPIVLDGTGTIDPDGDALSYEWKVDGRPSSGATLEVTDPDQLIASYSPSASGVHQLQLTATETETDPPLSCSRSFNLDVVNLPPLCPSSKPIYAADLADVLIDFSDASDPDGNELSFEWDFPSSGGVPVCGDADLSDLEGPTTTLTRGVPGEHTVNVEVSDGADVCRSNIIVVSTCNDEYATAVECIRETSTATKKTWVDVVGAVDPNDASNAYDIKLEDNQWRPVDATVLGLDGWVEAHTSWVRIKNGATFEPGSKIEGDYQIEYAGEFSASSSLIRGTFKIDDLREDRWAYGDLEETKRNETDETPGNKYCQ